MFTTSSIRARGRKRRPTSSRRSMLESLERRLALDASAGVMLVADVAVTEEDQAIDLSVLENDTGSQLEVTGVSDVVNGAATVNADGTITFSPDADFNGIATFQYTAADEFGSEATAAVAVAVTPVNDAPLAGHNRATLDAEGTATIDVLENDADVEGDLDVTQIAGTAVVDAEGDPLVDAEGDPLPVDVDGGSVVLNADGTLTFTADAGFTGRTAFEYTVEDFQGETATATVVVTSETFVNTAPVAGNDTIDVLEDGDPVSIDVLDNDEDPDGDPLTITEIDGAEAAVGAEVEVEGGAAVLNADGTITFTPEANFSGDATFTYTVSDGADGASATVTVSVEGESDPPEAAPDEATVDAGAEVEINVLTNDSDPDGDELTVTHIEGEAVVDAEGNRLLDGSGNPVEVDVEGGTVVLNEEGALTFTADEDFTGETSFEYTVSDGQNEATAAVHVLVEAPNDPPEADPDEATVEAGAEVEINVLANDSDPDGDELAVTHVEGEAVVDAEGNRLLDGDGNPVEVDVEGGTVVLNEEGALVFTADEDFTGEASFEYTVSDGHDETTAMVTVDVTSEVDPGNPLHNPDLPSDVDGDGRTNVRDLLMVVRALRELGFGELPEDADPNDTGMVDVNDDGLLTAADLIAVARSMRNGHGRDDDGPGNSSNAPGHNQDDNGPGNSANAPGNNGNGNGRGRGRR